MAFEDNDVTQIPDATVIPKFLPVKHLSSTPFKLIIFDLETTGLSKYLATTFDIDQSHQTLFHLQQIITEMRSNCLR